MVRELQGQHGVCVLEGDLLTVSGGSVWVDEGDHAEHYAAWLRQRDQPAFVPHQAPGLDGTPHGLLTASGTGFRIGVGSSGAAPCGEVAVAVLDGDRQPGQLMQCSGDAPLALPRRGYRGEAVVDVQAASPSRPLK